MKILRILLPILLFGCITASAQTLEEAKILLQNKQYYEALPAFKKFVTQQPNNANYNYGYGMCLLYTNDAKTAIKYLDAAFKKKVEDAALPLAEAQEQIYHFGTAATCYTAYRNTLLKRKAATKDIDRLIVHCRMGENMMQGIEKVCVVDSFVVDKNKFLKAYKISTDCGKLYMLTDYFHIPKLINSTVYETQRANRIYYADSIGNEKIKIYTRIKVADGWSEPKLLPDNINGTMNANYPFLSDDGITIYYAADGYNSLGGYDLFVTRYNTDNDSYLKPENIGMPFNSPYNDYMMVVDDYNHLGWFASDRYQPEDKVCVYVFIPNTTKQIYDSKKYSSDQLVSLAQLHSISDTWKDVEKIDSIRTSVANLLNQHDEVKAVVYDFTFVINETHTYHTYTDFQSEEAQKQFRLLKQEMESYETAVKKLKDLRNQYAQTNTSHRNALSVDILQLEQQTLHLEKEINVQSTRVRNLEIIQLNKK